MSAIHSPHLRSQPRSKHTSFPPRIQVAGISSLEEALYCRSVGVNSLGFTLMLPTGIHDDLTTDKARDIIRMLPKDILTVVITYVTQARQASDLVKHVGAAAVQFHGGISQTQIRLFRDLCPIVKTIGLVTVQNHSAIPSSRRFRPPLWDAIILDTIDTNTGQRGATGLTHDWSISAKIVQQSPIPVILAGGLTPKNVANAIRTVRPHAVDAHTGLEDEGGSRNYKKIEQFASIAREAFQAYVCSYIP